jgi:hypothetical protein
MTAFCVFLEPSFSKEGSRKTQKAKTYNMGFKTHYKTRMSNQSLDASNLILF